MWSKHLKTQFYNTQQFSSPEGALWHIRLSLFHSRTSTNIYLLIWRSTVELDRERCDSTATQRLFVLHDWTHDTMPNHRAADCGRSVTKNVDIAREDDAAGMQQEMVCATHSANDSVLHALVRDPEIHRGQPSLRMSPEFNFDSEEFGREEAFGLEILQHSCCSY